MGMLLVKPSCWLNLLTAINRGSHFFIFIDHTRPVIAVGLYAVHHNKNAIKDENPANDGCDCCDMKKKAVGTKEN